MSTPRPLLGDYHVTPWCQLGIGDTRAPTGQARWDVQLWDADDARWASTEPTWLDQSCEVVSASADAGRERLVDRFRPGAAEVVFRNVDGWADLTGPAVPPAELTLRPGRQIRFGVDTATGRHVLHRGYLDEVIPLYLPYAGDVAQCSSIDALAEVSRTTLAPLDIAVGDGETADVRVARLLDAVNWPPSYRDIDPTAVAVQSTTFGGQVADLLGVTADSAGGSVFGTLAGGVAYRPRDWQTYLPDTPPDATIGNVDPGDVCPVNWELSWRRRDSAAIARLGRPDGTYVERTDADGILVVGPETFVRADLITSDDVELGHLADRILRTRGVATMPRVEAVTLDAAYDPGDGSVVELMATARAETPTRIRCRLVVDGRAVFDADMFVTGTAHTITNTGRWTCRLALDVAAPFAAAGGRWDGSFWDRATWAVAV